MAIDRDVLQAQSQQLRLDLKTWEKAFADRTSTKPSRDDVKSNPEIAAKYKEYSRIRDILSMKVGPPPMPESPPSTSPKRKHRLSAHEGTPLKRRRHDVATPRKEKESAFPTVQTPSSHASTPRQPAFVGPTPQKDGRVLGLFDLMDIEEESAATPSKARGLSMVNAGRPALVETAGNHAAAPATPSKRSNLAAIATPATDGRRHARTPQSSAKRFLLDKFATPSKRKQSDEVDVLSGHPPLPDDLSATPSFLRRRSSQHYPTFLSTLPEEPVVSDSQPNASHDTAEKQTSPTKPRFTLRRSLSRPAQKPARGPGGFRSFTRSLSALMADVKHAYEARFDDDEAALRESEDAAEECSMPPPAPSHTGEDMRASTASSATLVNDSQPADLDVRLLGPDGSHAFSDSVGDDGPGGVRTYKKKGAKRQTRRVILKPAKKLPKPSSVARDGAVADADRTVSTGQKRRATAAPETDLPPERDGGDGTMFPYPSSSPSLKKQRTSASPSPSSTSPTDSTRRKDGNERNLSSAWSATTGTTASDPAAEKARGASIDAVRQATKRVSATATANFRKLKMRNSGSAGGGGKKWGRFRRGF